MRCKKPDGTFTVVGWKFIYINGSAIGAYVAASSVCRERLF